MMNPTRYLPLCCGFLLLLCLNLHPLTAQQKLSRQEYIDLYKEIAISQMRSHGIPASITLAQGCLESGDGNSTLAVEGNNHFGIKCHDWKGATIHRDDDKKNECFRKYKNAEASYHDHADFLRYRDRYAPLFDLEITDYKGWAYGLKQAGYATHPQYAQMLIKIIEDYQLYLIDQQGLKKGRKKKDYLPPSPAQLQQLRTLQSMERSTLYKHSQARTLYVMNGVAYIIANESDTYASLAKEYQLFTREILRFNDLKKEQELLPGTVVYLEKKKKKAPKHLELHIAEEGDTYYDIAQRYAIRLESLCEYNHATAEGSPREGDRVFLRRMKTY